MQAKRRQRKHRPVQVKGVTDLQRKLNRLGSTELRRAASSALNKTGALARTRIIRGVAKQAKVPVSTVRKRVYLVRARSGDLKIVQMGYARPVSLMSLIRNKQPDEGRRRRRKLRVNKQTYPNAFVRRGSNGNVQVFERNGKLGRQGKGRWAKYKNLEKLSRVEIPIQSEVNEVLPKVNRRTFNNEFMRLFQHEYSFRLRRIMGS